MDDMIKKYLLDIKDSIEAINRYLGENRNYKEFTNNRLLKRGVEREFEIIGEAINKALKIDKSLRITNAKRIVSLRNYIIHAYDNVNDATLWGIIINNMPELYDEINDLLIL